MGNLIAFVMLVAVVGFLWVLGRSLVAGARERDDDGGPALDGGESDLPDAGDSRADELYAHAAALQPLFDGSSHPEELLRQALFLEAVSFLCRPGWSRPELMAYVAGDNPLLACLALEALARRDESPPVRDTLLEHVNLPVPWCRFFLLRALRLRVPADEPIVGDVVARLDDYWGDRYGARYLRGFLEGRRRGGETPTFGDALDRFDAERAESIDTILATQPEPLVRELREELRRWRASRIDREYLRGVGTLWSGDPHLGQHGVVLSHDALEARVAAIEAAVQRSPRRSVALVGEHGVGKTAVVRSVAARLASRGWVVFEAGHAELVAGMSYIGQFEERLRELVGLLRGRPVLWYVPSLPALTLAGRHQYAPLSALDFLLPYVERGEIVIVGESAPGSHERLVQSKPRVATAFETLRVAPMDDVATRALVDRWAESAAADEVVAGPDVRREAFDLARQFLGDRSAPGNVLQVLQITRERMRRTDGGQVEIGTDDLIVTLSMLTGLPETILDERRGLDLGALRDLFDRRVLGQREASETLVERVAMIKAGTTDPTRPLGVFLFAGPTGTGKTEIAKTLSEFLFGSVDRMVRLDMSEFQSPEALSKIVGGPPPREGDLEGGGALVDRIRKQPFSVVLLDEFEKAAPQVWDLFLQVFDDGRLSDHQGNAVDFRNTIIILTSNLGAVIPSGAGLGFSEETGRFHAAAVLREVERSFRKEFLNRLDRVVVFRPFTRDVMREILRKELTDAFQRRGLRNRAWAVEWDEGAVEFLLERGFTADLGARPLKRAVERYVLAPLSTTIVEHRVPEGDQFLFLRADGNRLAVDFIDPDAPAHPREPAGRDEPAAGETPSLAAIGLAPTGSPGEIERLRAEHERLVAAIADGAWQDAKRAGLERMAEPGFWQSGDRFRHLGRVETVDRIEAGIEAAGSLLARLQGPGWKSRERFPADLVGRLAARLVLLDAAASGVASGEPDDAYVSVQAWSEGGTPSTSAIAFAREIAEMYRNWGRSRGMQIKTLVERASGARGPETILAVSGFAAWAVLRPEDGLHLLERPERDGHGFRKAAVRVRVAPQPDVPAHGAGPTGAEAAARDALAARTDESPAVVRHYRRVPSPLVRDGVHGWRTGHLDRVLAGDFDLRAALAVS